VGEVSDSIIVNERYILFRVHFTIWLPPLLVLLCANLTVNIDVAVSSILQCAYRRVILKLKPKFKYFEFDILKPNFNTSRAVVLILYDFIYMKTAG